MTCSQAGEATPSTCTNASTCKACYEVLLQPCTTVKKQQGCVWLESFAGPWLHVFMHARQGTQQCPVLMLAKTIEFEFGLENQP